MSKAKRRRKKYYTVEQLRHKRDLYYRRTHGISLKEYNAMDRRQHYRCKICRRPPKKLPLAVDHDHFLARRKVVTVKKGNYWVAGVPELLKCNIKIRKKDKVRKKAVKAAKLALRRLSVRGLLCWACNTGIRKYFDKARNLYRAARYLNHHQKRFKKLKGLRYGNL